MKKYVVLIALFFAGLLHGTAQLVPNGNFEDIYLDSWGNILPKHWTSNYWGMIIDSTYHQSKPHYPYNGKYAQVIFNRGNNSSDYSNTVGFLRTTFKISFLPKTAQGYFFYLPQKPNEKFLMKVVLYNRREHNLSIDTVGVGYAVPSSATTGEWAKAECDIQYYKAERPDSAEITIYASQPNAYSPTTNLIVDGIDFSDTLSALSVIETTQITQSAFAVYPNPAIHEIMVQNKTGVSSYDITITDVLGHTVSLHTSIIHIEDVHIPVSHLANGTYFIHVTTKNGSVAESHRMVLLR